MGWSSKYLPVAQWVRNSRVLGWLRWVRNPGAGEPPPFPGSRRRPPLGWRVYGLSIGLTPENSWEQNDSPLAFGYPIFRPILVHSGWTWTAAQSLFALDHWLFPVGNPPARRLFCGAFAPSKLSRRTDGHLLTGCEGKINVLMGFWWEEQRQFMLH